MRITGIGRNEKFDKIISTMRPYGKDSIGMDFMMLGYCELNFEGGLSGYKFFLTQPVRPMHEEDYKLLIMWISGNVEAPITLLSSDKIYHIFYKTEEENMDDEGDLLITKEEMEQEILERCARHIAERILEDMERNKIDNKFYGFRDENGQVIPKDYGFVNVADNAGEVCLTIRYTTD
ncbi:hypothetical protein LI177_05175 [bacterium 210820-DFI.6.37]|nr:hypothetical protein [bacterium 210820-DFI.6.37]